MSRERFLLGPFGFFLAVTAMATVTGRKGCLGCEVQCHTVLLILCLVSVCSKSGAVYLSIKAVSPRGLAVRAAGLQT